MINNIVIDDNSTEWKRVNMRSVAHLLGVEFVHDLYNRYDPKINSIRFRHTITVWKDGILNSYAPVSEWDQLGKIVGSQYYELDPSILKYTNSLYSRNRTEFHTFIKKIKNTDFSLLTNQKLSFLLLNFQSIVLGELYVLNFVQIEHGLNLAIKKVLKEIIPDKSKIEEIFVKIINTSKDTESQKEKRKLYYIAQKWKFLKKISMFSEKRAYKDIQRHYKKFKYLYSAYGEEPQSIDYFWSTFNDYMNGKIIPPKNFIFTQLFKKESKEILKKLNNKKLNTLVPLLIRGGIFRDENKSFLGQSMKYRFLILDEIVKRNFESRKNLNYYLLSEIIDLLNNSKKVLERELESREKNGVVLTRFEDFAICDNSKFFSFKNEFSNGVLYGQCASLGISTGECKVILTKEDIKKIKTGDIMIAIGTDFDLIEAMYRSAAVITEEGGILSHASVVCRELGKPCCIGVKNATILLKDGQKIQVDATNGKIIVLED